MDESEIRLYEDMIDYENCRTIAQEVSLSVKRKTKVTAIISYE